MKCNRYNIQFKTTYNSFIVHNLNAHFSHHSLFILVNLVWLIQTNFWFCSTSLKIWTVKPTFFLPRNRFVWKPDGWIRSQGSVQQLFGKLYPILSQPLRGTIWMSEQRQTPVPALISNQKLQLLDLSHNRFGDIAGVRWCEKASGERFTAWLQQTSE